MSFPDRSGRCVSQREKVISETDRMMFLVIMDMESGE